MVRLEQYDEQERTHLLGLECPVFATTSFVTGTVLAKTRLALISTAGLHLRGDRPFAVGESGYRLLPNSVEPAELVMSHISTNFDRTGYQRDLNVVLPLQRLRELARDGFIAGCADYHYSFMGATEPERMQDAARDLVRIMRQDRVGGVLLVPV